MERNRRSASQNEEIAHDEAELIWRDAARLQAEAARKLEERSVELAGQTEEIGTGADASMGFRLDEIRTIAEAAGISREFVELAIMRLNARRADGTAQERDAGWPEQLVNHRDRSIEVSRVMHSAPDETYEAMRRVFLSPAYNLTLVDVVGDATDERILVFQLPAVGMSTISATSFAMKMAHAGLKQIYVAIHPMDDNKCQVTIRSDLAASRRTHAIATAVLLSVVAPLLSIIPAAITATAGGTSPWVVFLVWLLSVLVFGRLELAGLRWMYRWGVGKGEEGLTELLQVVETDARTKGDFSAAPAWPDATKGAPSTGDDPVTDQLLP